jgi:hypothetical protein
LRDKIVNLDKHVTQIPKDELREKLGKLKNSELIRSLIINERDFGQCNYDRTLRSFWYSTIKPTLDKLGKLKSEDVNEDKLTKWDATLSRYMSEFANNGIVAYQDLHIVDESRSRKVKSYYSFSPCRNIAICVEKDTTYNLICDISDLLGCSCYSAKGLNSVGAMEDFIRKIRDNSHETVKDIHLLILSDYDPAGMTIANALKTHAENMVRLLKMDGCKVHAERIGITPEQLTPEELENNWYSPKGDMKKWVEETGGINGLPKGLELDALSQERMREIFATSLKNYIDTADYVEECKRVYLNNKVYDAIRPYVDKIVDELVEYKKDDVGIKDFDILDYAKQGYNYLPSSEVCYIDNDNINDLVSKYFEKAV